MPEVARLLGISERGVRDKIERGQLRAEKDGKRWMVLLPAAATTATDAVASGSTSGSGAVARSEPVEVHYRVAPAELEQAIERTGGKYVADMQTMFDRVGRLYEAQLAAKDETIRAKDASLTAKDGQLAATAEMIAALRWRAEAAERERDTLRGQLTAQAQLSPQAPEQPAASWWRRLVGLS